MFLSARRRNQTKAIAFLCKIVGDTVYRNNTSFFFRRISSPFDQPVLG